MHQGIGQTSVLGSVFNNNVAGSNNVEDGEMSLLQRVQTHASVGVRYIPLGATSRVIQRHPEDVIFG